VGLILDRAQVLLAAPGAGLLLDLDATLLDSEPVHAAACLESLRGRGWRVPDDVSEDRLLARGRHRHGRASRRRRQPDQNR
jgi:sugar-phosphatase